MEYVLHFPRIVCRTDASVYTNISNKKVIVNFIDMNMKVSPIACSPSDYRKPELSIALLEQERIICMSNEGMEEDSSDPWNE